VTADLTRQASPPLTVSFSGEASFDPEGGPLAYSWTFSDGTPTASGATVSHTFFKTGRFPVTLEVVDKHGARDSVSVLISTCVSDVVLTHQSVSDVESFLGCSTVTAESGFVVTATGDVTFRAGRRIVLGNGFSVEDGGRFKAVIDPSITP
jgi:PKD repeat protein